MAVLKDLIVHGASRFINVAQYSSAKGGVIAADKGVFNKLIATSAEINTLNVEELNADRLTAQNATVMGLLDVKGNLHTNSWTNSNIATIQGAFYIAPTVMTGTSSGDSGVTITAISRESETDGYWTLVLSGDTNILTFPNLEADKATSAEDETSYNAWSPGSLVMVTGSIKKDGITYPLGTLKGELSGTISSNRVTITNITDNLNANPSTLQEYGAGTYGYVEIKISLYQRAYSNNLYPLGILMSAQGRASKSFIDIYGGGNIYTNGNLDPQSATTHTSDYGGLAIPNVRIGNLRGLPNVLTGDFEDNAGLPTGWGIYTDNGFFKGVVVADSGSIGHFTINSKAIYSGSHSAWNTSATGIFLGTNDTNYYISGGSGASWWIRDDGRFQFGGTSGIRYDGRTLTVPAANVTGNLSADTMSANIVSALNGKFNNLQALSANLGGWTVEAGSSSTYGGAIYKNTFGSSGGVFLTPGYTTTSTAIEGTSASKTWMITAGANFGVTTAGTMYATGANILTATIGNASNKITIGTGTSGHSSVRYGMTTLTDTTHNGFYIGTDGIALGGGKFKVTAAGAITATGFATTSEVQAASEQASKYILPVTTQDNTSGIQVHTEGNTESFVQIVPGEITIYTNGESGTISALSLTSEDITIGDENSTHIVITADSLSFLKNKDTTIMSMDSTETSFKMGGYTWVANEDRLTLWS